MRFKQDTSHRDAEHYNIAGPERICNSGRIKVDGDRRRQAVIESEKDYQRQCTQNGADNNMLCCGLHKVLPPLIASFPLKIEDKRIDQWDNANQKND